MKRRSFSWTVALLGVVLAGVLAVSAAAALATSSAASPFELVFEGRWEWDEETDPDGWLAVVVGTFASSAPFCESGTAVDVEPYPGWLGGFAGGKAQRYTCSDGSGSLTLDMTNPRGADRGKGRGEWTIVEGSGRYADLQGKGTYSGEVLEVDPVSGGTIAFRTAAQGFAGADAVAPSLAFTSASATKQRRPAGFYSIDVALSLRDDSEGNAVAYALSVWEGGGARDRRGLFLDGTEGSTASGSVSTTLHVFPSSKRVRSVQLVLSGTDPVGNEVSITRSLKLPRR